MVAHLCGVPTTTITSARVPTVKPCARERPPATPGARLASVSRAAQGFAATVDDPAVIARLRDLCAAPRPQSRPTSRR
ncbi:MAG: hypothetical protein LBS27_11860 [Bifidobacteriaceae bacterium]|nr:hypothetical protein [Bifidobacteriaceae bacterium]